MTQSRWQYFVAPALKLSAEMSELHVDGAPECLLKGASGSF